ncbi:type II toxin-antitoxin system RelE family toxin [Kribbella deserti]|uniref:Type II toxin-antitoxin system RelE/ParE family toxin n=1 Tax=Kribbella deserti TaxID=1926257 RepID=A0ABV6QVM6_9ACTN
MSPAKRNDRVAPPAEPGKWEMRFGTSDAAKSWEELCRQAPGNTRKAWEKILADPRPHPPDGRHHQLKGKLATVDGLKQWQVEVTNGGRIWCVIDDARKTIYLRFASTGHPKMTD